MPKLAKLLYTTSKGERRLNCYMLNIKKEIVDKANLAGKNLQISAKGNTIIIEEAHYVKNTSR